MEAAHADPQGLDALLRAPPAHVLTLQTTLAERGPEQALALAEADGTRRVHNLYEMGVRKKKSDHDQVVERHRAGATAAFLEDQKLIQEPGSAWLLRRWPGDLVGAGHLSSYVQIGRHIPAAIVDPVVLGLLDQLFREVRHALGITYAGLHDVTDLPGPMVSRATEVAVFGGTSPEHHSKLRGLRREFHPFLYDDLKDLPRGTCALGANQTSDPKCTERAQIITLRPSCVYAGGETLMVQQPGTGLWLPK